MTLDTRALTGAALLVIALLIDRDELVPWLRRTGRALSWCLRKLWWLVVLTLLFALLILAIVVTVAFEGFAELTGFGQRRHIALVMRRRHP